MRQAIRVYAMVALILMVALLAGLWLNPHSLTAGEGWLGEALQIVGVLQLWALLVIPLGVLAASDAAHTGRRGWQALFVALIVLTPIAFWLDPLVNNVSYLFTAPCGFNGGCDQAIVTLPEFSIRVGWAVAFLVIPITALVYALRPSLGVTPTAETGRSERRALMMSAIAGAVIMGAAGYLWTSRFLQYQITGSEVNDLLGAFLTDLTYVIWVMLLPCPSRPPARRWRIPRAQAGVDGWRAGSRWPRWRYSPRTSAAYWETR